MATKVMVSELGKCYNKSADGFYRLYKTDGLWTIYLVGKEMIWNEDNSDYILGNKLEAVFGGYISEPENFEYGVDALKSEARYL